MLTVKVEISSTSHPKYEKVIVSTFEAEFDISEKSREKTWGKS